jgi:hypothetical protein
MANTTWNPSDKTGAGTLSGGNLTFLTGGTTSGVRSIASAVSGKCYWEYTSPEWSTNQVYVGVANGAANLASIGNDGLAGCGVLGHGGLNCNGGSVGTLGTLPNNGHVGVALDETNKLIWFRVAPSGNWNGSGTANPATGVGGISVAAIAGAGLFGVAASANFYSGIHLTANFGDSAFTGAVPSGFNAGFPPPSAITARQNAVTVISG